MNLIVGRLLRSPHTLPTDFTAFRIEDKATIGDAGSRIKDEEELRDLKRMDAKFVSPRLQSFLYNIWAPPSHLECDF